MRTSRHRRLNGGAASKVANERNVSLPTNCRVQLAPCKVSRLLAKNRGNFLFFSAFPFVFLWLCHVLALGCLYFAAELMLNHFNKKCYGNKEQEPLLEQIADYWGRSEIIDSYRRNELHGMEFMKECQDYIPASALQRYRLWGKLSEDEKKQLKIRILS